MKKQLRKEYAIQLWDQLCKKYSEWSNTPNGILLCEITWEILKIILNLIISSWWNT